MKLTVYIRIYGKETVTTQGPTLSSITSYLASNLSLLACFNNFGAGARIMAALTHPVTITVGQAALALFVVAAIGSAVVAFTKPGVSLGASVGIKMDHFSIGGRVTLRHDYTVV